jgi:hypothetical protein
VLIDHVPSQPTVSAGMIAGAEDYAARRPGSGRGARVAGGNREGQVSGMGMALEGAICVV